MFEITTTIKELKRLQNALKHSNKERLTALHTASDLRAEIRKLTRLLKSAIEHIPATSSNPQLDKLFQEADEYIIRGKE